MSGEEAAKSVDAPEAKDAGDADSRQRSTIAFPYNDLTSAVQMAQAIHDHVGAGDCDDDQLAAWTEQSPKSSGYRVQLAATKLFGLIETTGGRHSLTQLGRMIVDPNRTREARARAFLNVPLYRAVFDKYRGGVIPPAAALERDMEGLGVAPKMKDRARRVFERAAEQGGYFEHGRNRLVQPGIASRGDEATPDDHEEEEEKDDRRHGGGGGDFGGLHPFIQGLLTTLPEPASEWDAAARVKWLQTAANIFDLIYKGEGGIEVTSATAHRSPRPHD